MAQISWYYTFPYGRKYEIGIFHSDDGHVVVHCDGEIMNIEFNVLDSRSFSFYIENKLLKISVTKEDSGRFSYLLEDLTPVASPGPKMKKDYPKLQIWLGSIMVVGFVVLLFWIFIFYRQ